MEPTPTPRPADPRSSNHYKGADRRGHDRLLARLIANPGYPPATVASVDELAGTLAHMPLTSIGPSGIGGEYQAETHSEEKPDRHAEVAWPFNRILDAFFPLKESADAVRARVKHTPRCPHCGQVIVPND